MNNNFKKISVSFIKFALTVVFTAGLVATVTYAGSIIAPEGDPTAQSYTLSDIYNKIKFGTTATAGNHSLAPTTTPQTTFHSLTDVYNVAVSLTHMWNGTCDNTESCGPDHTSGSGGFNTTVPGGSIANGGSDDFNGYNLGGTPPAGRYSTTWTQCNVGNQYCGTNDDGAQVKDEATGLIWSYQCMGEGCSAWDKTDQATLVTGCLPDGDCAFWDTDAYYTWDNSGVPVGGNTNKVGNGGKTASQLCSQHSGWYLPNQRQLMQAYIDGSYGNIVPQGVERWYWSSTVYSGLPATYAWYVDLSFGYTYNYYKAYQAISVICVQE
jgi:hypothetical protein